MKQIQWYPGHMVKTIKEIKKSINLVDIVFELIDARLPFSSKNPLIDEIINDKPKLIILNKSNLADRTDTLKWLNYYNSRENSFAIDVDLISGYNVSKILPLAKKILEPLIEKRKEKMILNKSLRILIVGIPNVGKSTLINILGKKKKAKTGDKPGITKANQWVKINDDFDLLDTPGILWPKFEDKTVGYNLALSGAIKDEILPKDDVVLFGLEFMYKYYKENFMKKYMMENFNMDNTLEIYNHIAELRKCYNQDGYDYEKVLDLILYDLRNRELGGITFDKNYVSL